MIHDRCAVIKRENKELERRTEAETTFKIELVRQRGLFMEKMNETKNVTMNDTMEQLINRKSVRVFTEREIGVTEKQLILRAATEAPTAGNQQLYTIIDVTDQTLKNELVKTCDNQPFIAAAKMVLIFCADCRKWYEAFKITGCEPRNPGVGDMMLAVSDANIAAQNAVVAAESLGIGSCYIGDVMENYERQRELLRLPEYVFPAAMLVFGYPTEQQKNRIKPERAPMEAIVSENRYPEMNETYYQELFGYKTNGDYKGWMKRFCERKYNSDFAREMTRSVGKYITSFLTMSHEEA